MSDPTPWPLRGRSAEWAALTAALSAARARSGAAVILVGSTGMGKSVLLEAAAAEALGDGFMVLSVAGSAQEADLPYAGLQRLLEPAMRPAVADETWAPLQHMLHTGDHTGVGRRAAYASVLSLLCKLAASRPVLVVVDDAHHLDQPSAAALCYVARRLAGTAIGVLIAESDSIADTALDRAIPRHQLSRLDDHTALALLNELTPARLAGDVADALVAMAAGNPLAIGELARSLSPGQIRGAQPPPHSLPANSRLRAAHRARLAQLSPPARWLTVLVAADEDISVNELAEAAKSSGTELTVIDEALAAGIVSIDGNRVVIADPLMRHVAYDDARLADRRSAHRVLGAVTSGGANRLRHLLHRAAAADGRETRLARLLADGAGTGAPALASVALERAADLNPRPVEAATALVAAARFAWLGGQPTRARVLLQRAHGTELPAEVQAQAQALDGEIELRVGTTTRARSLLLDAASALSRDGHELTLDTLILAGEAMTVAGRHSDFVTFANQLAATPLPGGRPAAEFLQAYAYGQAAAYSGDLGRSAAQLQRVITLAADLDNPTASVRAAVAATLLGDPLRSHDLASQAIGQATGAGAAAIVPHALELISFAELTMGRNGAAALAAAEGLHAARSTGQLSLADNFLATLAVLAAIDRDRESCDLRLREIRRAPGDGDMSQSEAFLAWALGIADLHDGQHARALARLRPLMCDNERVRGNTMVRIPATVTLIEAAARCGELALARDKLYILDVWVERSRSTPWLALAARSHALVAADHAEAEWHFEDALLHHAAAGADHGQARTELLYGQFLRRVRRPGAARAHLRAALATFEQLGVVRWAAEAGAQLRAAGERVERSRPVPTETPTPTLTPQQRLIADLVTNGATNKEIAIQLYLSPRTVEHHLRNIYSRLGLRSRTDLVRQLTR